MRGVAGEMGATPTPRTGQPDPSQYPIGVEPGQAAPAPRGTPIPQQPRLGYGAIAPDVAAPVPQGGEMVQGGGQNDRLAGGLNIQPSPNGGPEGDQLNDPPRQTPNIREVDPGSSGFRQDIDGTQRNREIITGLSRISGKLATGGANPVGRVFGAVRDYVSEDGATAADNAASRSAAAEAQKWYQSGDAVEYFSANPDQLEAAAQDPVGFYAAKDGTVSPELRSSVAQSLSGRPGDKVPEGAKEVERTASQPVQQEEAAAGIKTAERVALSFGLKPGENATKKQMDRGSQAYVDRYYEEVAPKMVQFYIGRGEMDKAQAYVDLIEGRQGKTALRSIGRATFSVVNGDYDGAAEHMLEAFKAYDYVDDAMEVDLDATGIMKDEGGNPVGGKVVFVDKKSGDRFEKTFATPDEFIQYGHLMTSPSTVAELLMKQKPEAKGAISQKDIVDAAIEITEGRHQRPEDTGYGYPRSHDRAWFAGHVHRRRSGAGAAPLPHEPVVIIFYPMPMGGITWLSSTDGKNTRPVTQ